jgi:hypothetical protein
MIFIALKIEPKPQAHKGTRGLRVVFAFIPIIQRTCYTKMRVGMMLCIVLLVNQSNGREGWIYARTEEDTQHEEAENTRENRLIGWREHKRKNCEMDE